MAHGLYGGDEALHGNNPTQGSELCSAVEMMFTLESMLDDHRKSALRRSAGKDCIQCIAYPGHVMILPTRQYFQQANQVMITRHMRNFDVNHEGTDVCYGLLSGYPCCTSNMHQGWPKFTQNLWYATADKGVAALVYSPSEVNAFVANGVKVHSSEETNYPFSETIRFTLATDKKVKSVAFPFHLRVPAWCKKATVLINGNPGRKPKAIRL